MFSLFHCFSFNEFLKSQEILLKSEQFVCFYWGRKKCMWGMFESNVSCSRCHNISLESVTNDTLAINQPSQHMPQNYYTKLLALYVFFIDRFYTISLSLSRPLLMNFSLPSLLLTNKKNINRIYFNQIY